MPTSPATDAGRLRGVALMLASAFGFSVMSLLVKGVSRELPTMEIVFVRSLFMTAATAALVVHAGAPLLGVDRRTLAARGLIGATAMCLLYWSLGRLPLGDVTTVHYTAPVWTALAAAWLLGERVRVAVVAGVAASLVGVVLVARPTTLVAGAAVDPPAVAAALASALASGVAYTLVRKLRATDAPPTIILWLSAAGIASSAPFALTGAWRWPSAVAWLVLAGIGVATLVGQFALTHALRLLEAGTAITIGYAQIVFAFGWGAIVFGERPSAGAVAGAALVMASVALVARSTASSSPTDSPVLRNRL